MPHEANPIPQPKVRPIVGNAPDIEREPHFRELKSGGQLVEASRGPTVGCGGHGGIPNAHRLRHGRLRRLLAVESRLRRPERALCVLTLPTSLEMSPRLG
jgi:hypothetical protein